MRTDSEQSSGSAWRDLYLAALRQTRPNPLERMRRRSSHLIFVTASCAIQVSLVPHHRLMVSKRGMNKRPAAVGGHKDERQAHDKYTALV